MSIIRFDPFRNDVMSWQKQMFSPFFEGSEDWPELTMTQGLNVYEEGENVIVKAAVPGIPQEKLNITYEDGVLHIQGRVEESEEEKDKKRVVYKKHMITNVDYTTYLPRAVDSNRIEATTKDGVLTITAPIADAVKAKKIEVKSS